MDNAPKIYHYPNRFQLESGEEFDCIDIAYHTYGTLSSEKDNVVWVCHALTANSDVADWWPHTVEKGCFLDPDKYFVVCANILGSCYGSTGPMSINPATGKPYYATFPTVTMRDIVKAHQILAKHLGIGEIFALIGSSVGGFQASEWAVAEPERFKRLALIATEAYASPWAIAIDETQRMAIMADKTYGSESADAGKDGLAAARAIGLLTYRGGKGYNISQRDSNESMEAVIPQHRAVSYQQYQGEKLVRRFDAYSYMSILNSFDTHNVGRGRGGLENALATLKMPTLVLGITTDLIFPPEDLKGLCSRLGNAEYKELTSDFGHDGFLVEHEKLNRIMKIFMGYDS